MTAVAKKETTTEVAVSAVKMPSFVVQTAVAGSGAGNEKMKATDLQIPRLVLLQDLSPECNERKPEFIKGAKPGMILNKLNGQLMENCFVINLKFDYGFTVWKSRKLGGGLFGSFASEAEAQEALIEAKVDPAHYEIKENPVHYVLLLDENGVPTMPAIVDFTSTKIKVSKNWNSQIATQGDKFDRFAWVWMLSTVYESNNQSQEYYNFKVEFLGAAPEELHAQAQKFYDQVKGN